MIDKIVGQKFKTKYNDEILVLEQMPKIKGKNLLFRCEFIKYPCEVFREKSQILSGSCVNPLQEQKEFIDKIWPQNCGDSLRIIKKSDVKFGYYLCEFIKYPYTKEFQKTKIIQGRCVNPNIEQEEFIEKEFPQNCGDILKVLKKTNKRIKEKGNCFYECEFQKYPYKILALKQNILKGSVVNPLIEKYEFLEQIWSQHCGDSLKIIKEVKYKGERRFECEFIKYPYKVFARYETIKAGEVDNPRIEEEEFLNKIWEQKCGDSVRVERSKKFQIWKRSKTKLYKFTFIKYPYCGYGQKIAIKEGRVDNPNLPYKSKGGILNVIKEYFPNKKPTLFDLSNKLNISISHLGHKIIEYNLQKKINFAICVEEKEVRDYCHSLDNSFLENSTCRELKGGYEIDIYSPKLKLGFEFNGDYWHSDEVINKTSKGKFKTSEEKDKFKYNLAKEKGINLYFIWEHDWKNRPEVVKRYIKIIINEQLSLLNKN